jgi:hypothetical protein
MDFLILRARVARVSKDEEIHLLMAASPFETPPCGRLLRVRPPYATALPAREEEGCTPPNTPCSPISRNW